MMSSIANSNLPMSQSAYRFSFSSSLCKKNDKSIDEQTKKRYAMTTNDRKIQRNLIINIVHK